MSMDLWFKISVTAAANLVGVFVVKWAEEKKRKDKLWKIALQEVIMKKCINIMKIL